MNTKNKFYLLLVGIIFLLSACNDHEEKAHAIKNSEKNNSIVMESMINNLIQDSIANQEVKETKNLKKSKKVKSTNYTFTFKNFNDKASTLHLKNDIYDFTNITQPIVMINLSSTWCPPCRGEVPHLNSLQKKFKNNLFILTALVHDNINDDELKKLIVSEKAYFFVSTNQDENEKFEKMIIKKLGINENLKLPLMILFNNGKYFTHYEGSMPEEMIESDIKQLLTK